MVKQDENELIWLSFTHVHHLTQKKNNLHDKQKKCIATLFCNMV